jgi:energy-coupling factor transport system ATP-binding protein
VLILDEPTAGLDPAGCRQIMDNICRYQRESGATVLIVSHNMDDAARLCERLIVFDHGHLVMDGTPEEVFSRPEELIAIGLAVPQATSIAMALRERGLSLEGSVYTHEQLLAAIVKAKEAAAC